MVRITERAAVQLQGVLLGKNALPGQGVRLAVDGTGGITMTIDAPHEGDVVIHREETPVLIVARTVAARLTGAVVDCEAVDDSGRMRPGLVLRRRPRPAQARPAS
jgi:Fe-S cluster assembly iron-binding protein IscA